MSDTITDRKTAVALVKYERDRSKVVYADYIAANAVTLETVSDHVAALQALAFPKFDAKTASNEEKYERKTFGNRVRNGLNHTLGKHLVAREEPETPETGADADDTPETPESAPETTPPTVTIPEMSTDGLASIAEDVVRELIIRANAGDSVAMSTLNTLGAAIDVADVRPYVDGSRMAIAV